MKLKLFIHSNVFKIIVSLMVFSNVDATYAEAKKEVVGIFYLKNLFAHLHQNPNRYSASLTTLACGHPIKVLQIRQEGLPAETVFNSSWNYVSVGPYEGYIKASFLSSSKPECFQDKYPKFFDNFDLDLSELYYWGRLSDLYYFGKSKVK